MTACVNNEGLSGKKVVSATLAGVLAAGMVPAIAFADEAAEASTDEGIDLLAVSKAEAFQQGAVTEATDNNAKAIADLENIEFAYEATVPHYVKPTKVTPKGDTKAVDVTDSTEYDINYYTEANYKAYIAGSADTKISNADTGIIDAGTYYAVVVPKSGGEYYAAGNKGVAIKFSIVGTSLKDATLKNADKADVFTYNGKAQDLSVYLGDNLVDPANYDIAFYKNDGTALGVGVKPEDAGKYIATVTGKNQYKGSTVNIPLTVEKLDLSKANIVLEDKKVGDTASLPGIASVNGDTDATTNLDTLTVSYDASKNGNKLYNASATADSYKFDITAPENDPNVIGAGVAAISVVDDLGVISFDGSNALPATFTVDHGAGQSDIDFTKLKLYASDGSTPAGPTGDAIKDIKFDITVTDKDHNPATLADVKTPGVWNVSIKVNSAANKYAWGGEASTVVTVTDATIEGNSNLYVRYKGVLQGNQVKADYSGSNIMNDVEIVLEDGNGNVLVENTDYAVKVADQAGNEVTEVVNADTYTVTVSSKKYDIKNNTFTVVVDPLEINGVEFAGTSTYLAPGANPGDDGVETPFYPYTGDVVTPSFTYVSGKDAKGEDIVVPLPADSYKVVYDYYTDPTTTKRVGEMKEEGKYKVTLSAASGNYTINAPASPLEIEVANKKVFGDVSSADWFYNVVYQANDLGYMTGYQGGKLFGANHTITRADVICVLYNMAGGTNNVWDAVVGHDSFTDVNSNAYYAKALAWAKGLGIANGYADGTFNPEGAITRQDFACLLANYAKRVGNFEAPKDINAVLAKYPDGAQVADYAKENVAWACDKEIMGNAGVINPASNITRAEVAAMVVNYQPDGKLQA
ncbi:MULTISPECIES: S-layer homology domain-containing protein [Gordonibacter]|uniref:S-layer homology domain-containing protein n=1 Tax=Gordonibacter faecis TaxID=3047475 RepID=A0ABT7DL46_9ACTN|nr:S-layer homology domain-containing protein [Gordonibacter sp. KGMB12511]MDJ1650249.1 S-layer homology domain-containing protein [Gordonibacter sp. KGMB12511]